MAFLIEYIDHPLVDQAIADALPRYNVFFEREEKPWVFKIYLVKDRTTFTKLSGRESTENWQKARAEATSIFLIAPEALEEATQGFHHYDEKSYYKTVQHELAHCYWWLIHKNTPYFRVNWMNEGLATYLSWQNEDRQKPEKFSQFLNFWDTWGKEGYLESGFVVQKLVEYKGNKVFLKLIESLAYHKEKSDFLRTFEELYGFSLSYEAIQDL